MNDRPSETASPQVPTRSEDAPNLDRAAMAWSDDASALAPRKGMSKKRKVILLLVPACLVVAVVATAVGYYVGGSVTGWLHGDGGGQPGAGIILCLRTSAGCTTDPKLETTTDADGRFTVPNVPVGEYVVLFDLGGKIEPWEESLQTGVTEQTDRCLTTGNGGACEGAWPFGNPYLVGNLPASDDVIKWSSFRGMICSGLDGLCLEVGHGVHYVHVWPWGWGGTFADLRVYSGLPDGDPSL